MIQCFAIFGTPAKRHLNGVSLAGRYWLTYGDIRIFPLINLVGHPPTNLSGSAHELSCNTAVYVSFYKTIELTNLAGALLFTIIVEIRSVIPIQIKSLQIFLSFVSYERTVTHFCLGWMVLTFDN